MDSSLSAFSQIKSQLTYESKLSQFQKVFLSCVHKPNFHIIPRDTQEVQVKFKSRSQHICNWFWCSTSYTSKTTFNPRSKLPLPAPSRPNASNSRDLPNGIIMLEISSAYTHKKRFVIILINEREGNIGAESKVEPL